MLKLKETYGAGGAFCFISLAWCITTTNTPFFYYPGRSALCTLLISLHVHPLSGKEKGKLGVAKTFSALQFDYQSKFYDYYRLPICYIILGEQATLSAIPSVYIGLQLCLIMIMCSHKYSLRSITVTCLI